MNNALEPGSNDTPVAIGIQPGVPVIAPNLTAKGIDHGTAEDATSPEGHGAGRFVRENLRPTGDHIDQGATVRGNVITGTAPEGGKPFGAYEVIGREDHVPIGSTRQFKRRVELRTNGKVRHLNIPDAVLVKEVDIELIPRSDGGENTPDAP